MNTLTGETLKSQTPSMQEGLSPKIEETAAEGCCWHCCCQGPLWCSLLAGQGTRPHWPHRWDAYEGRECCLSWASRISFLTFFVFCVFKVIKLAFPKWCLKDSIRLPLGFCTRIDDDDISPVQRYSKMGMYILVVLFLVCSLYFARSDEYRNRAGEMPKLRKLLDKLIQDVSQNSIEPFYGEGSDSERKPLSSQKNRRESEASGKGQEEKGNADLIGEVKQAMTTSLKLLPQRHNCLGWKEVVIGILCASLVYYLRSDPHRKKSDHSGRTDILMELAALHFCCATLPLGVMVQNASLKLHRFWFQLVSDVLNSFGDHDTTARVSSASSGSAGSATRDMDPRPPSPENKQQRVFRLKSNEYMRLLRELQDVSNESALIFGAFQITWLGLMLGTGVAVWYGDWSLDLIILTGLLMPFWVLFMWSFADLASITDNHRTYTCVRLWELCNRDSAELMHTSHPMKDFADIVRIFPAGFTIPVINQILTGKFLLRVAFLPVLNTTWRLLAHIHKAD